MEHCRISMNKWGGTATDMRSTRRDLSDLSSGQVYNNWGAPIRSRIIFIQHPRSHVLWMPFVHNESMHRHICSRLKGFKLLPNIVKSTTFNSRVPAIELSNSPHESVTQTSAMRPSSDVEHDHDRLIVDTLGRTTDNIYWFPRTHFRKECIIGTPCFNRYRTILVDFRNGRIVLLYPETQSGHHL